MRIETALFSSREGLSSHGQAIAVVSDNISNVETTGYKSARAEFGDMLSNGTGSKDAGPLQGGNGSKVTSIRQIHQSGEATFTGRQLDVAIAGDGFFVVGDPADPSYTRAGNFQLDVEGNLVTPNGLKVLGTSANADGTAGTLTPINLLSLTESATATTKITLQGNVSSQLPVTTIPANATSFNQLGQAASAVQSIEAYDTLGNKHDVYLAFFKTGVNTWTANAYVDGGDVGGTAGVPSLVGSKTGLVFENDGSIALANKAGAVIAATAPYSNGAAAGAFTIDISGYTQNANPSEQTSKVQDGLSSGAIKAYEIRANGEIYATLTNGSISKVVTLQLAKFANVDGMVRQGNNLYRPGGTAGERTMGAPDSSGLGSVQGGALERSTVDMSGQFVDLVVLQRGYQANSQMLSAASQILRDTISLIR